MNDNLRKAIENISDADEETETILYIAELQLAKSALALEIDEAWLIYHTEMIKDGKAKNG